MCIFLCGLLYAIIKKQNKCNKNEPPLDNSGKPTISHANMLWFVDGRTAAENSPFHLVRSSVSDQNVQSSAEGVIGLVSERVLFKVPVDPLNTIVGVY